MAGSPVTTFITPAGRPAATAHSARASMVIGVCSAGLTMTEQPAAIAGATLRDGSRAGKFHVVKAATGPTAWCSTMSLVSREWPSPIVRP